MNEKIKSVLQRCLVVINSLEWSEEGGTDYTRWGACPECHRADWHRHSEDCELGKLQKDLHELLNGD